MCPICAPPAVVEGPHGVAADAGREVGVAHRHLDAGVTEQLLHRLERDARTLRRRVLSGQPSVAVSRGARVRVVIRVFVLITLLGAPSDWEVWTRSKDMSAKARCD